MMSIRRGETVERTAASTIHWDLEGKITFVSQGAEEVFQYRSDELVGRERVSVFSPGMVFLEHVPAWLKKSVANGHFETDTIFYRKDGSQFAAHIRITPVVEDGIHTGYTAVATPLLERSVEEVTPPISPKTKILRWALITRAPFATSSMVAAMFGAVLAPWLVSSIDLDIGLMLLTMLGIGIVQLATNTTNDYFDWKSGVDDLNTDYISPLSGGSRMIQLGVITHRGMLWTSAVLFALAAAVGVYLAAAQGIWTEVAVLALLGGLIAIFYTAPPVRLAARGLGELALILAFGPLVVTGAVLVQTGTLEPKALLVGLPAGLLAGLILWVNEFPDVTGDAAGGKLNLVVRLGLERARWGYVAQWALCYAFIVGFVIVGLLPMYALLGLGTIPLALYVTRLLFRDYRSRAVKGPMAKTIQFDLATTLLIIFGVWLAA